MPPCTKPCPCTVLILTPDLCPDPVYAALPSNIPYSTIFALFFLPSPAIHLALPLPSTMACPALPSPCPSYPLASHLLPSALPIAMLQNLTNKNRVLVPNGVYAVNSMFFKM